MTDKINGRTPEEIYKALRCVITQINDDCEDTCDSCKNCPNNFDGGRRELAVHLADAIVRIQQLEAERDQYKRERDAAVERCVNADDVSAGYYHEIQQLESAQPKWISIKEQLPTRELRVLTINGHGLIRIFGFFKRTEKAWTWIDDAGHFNHCNDITHWMPLPKAPHGKAHFI